jgi:hypothetical protein
MLSPLQSIPDGLISLLLEFYSPVFATGSRSVFAAPHESGSGPIADARITGTSVRNLIKFGHQ